MGGWVADRRLASGFQAAKDGAISTAATGSGARGRRPKAAGRAPSRAAAIDRRMLRMLRAHVAARLAPRRPRPAHSKTGLPDAVHSPVPAARALRGLQCPALRDFPLRAGGARRAGVGSGGGSEADPAFSRRAYRPDHPRRSSAKPSEKSRHAHDGRAAHPQHRAHRHHPVRQSRQSVRMAGDPGYHGLRRDRLHRRPV